MVEACSENETLPNLVFILTDEQRYDTSFDYGNEYWNTVVLSLDVTAKVPL